MQAKSKKQGRGRILRRIWVGILIFTCLLGLSCMAAAGAAAIYVDSHTKAHIDMSLFDMMKQDSGSTLYYYEFDDRENRIGQAKVLTTLSSDSRSGEYIAYERVPTDLVDAFVAIEDQLFWEHRGVNWGRSALAAINYFFPFQNVFGASTITQQLIKNITGEDEQTPERKMQEIRWALDLEAQMDKREIMELYLNIINLADGCYGIGAAAEHYFSKEVEELSLLECVAIASITNNPARYNPVTHPEANQIRRDLILVTMKDLGYLTDEEFDSAYGKELILSVKQSEKETKTQSWYVDMVVEDVIYDLAETYGYTTRAASLMVYYGGLQIYTAVDTDVQKVLEKYYLSDSHFPDGSAETPMQSAMIVIDPVTGDILGVVGARREKTGDRVQSYATDTVRPAGSSIKPLSVYAPALQNGLITYGSVFDDVPVDFGKYNLDSRLGIIVKPSPWPRNSPNIYRGLTTVNQAITNSINTIAVRVLEKLSVEKSFSFLHDTLQMESLIDRRELSNGRVLTDMDIASLALGQQNYGITVREITGAYSIFANQGTFNETRSYYTVTDEEGNVLLNKPYRGYAVLSEENAFIMTKMLQNVVSSGTAKDITLDRVIPTAGKTGTTQNDSDKWFIGYTPYFIGGVWCGYEYPASLSDFDGNPCVEIWNDIMWTLHAKYLNSGRSIKQFETPSGIVRVTYCRDSGKLMTSACYADPRGNRSDVGYFVKGTEPTTRCTCHVFVDYDGVNGGVAMPYTPVSDIVRVGLIKVQRDFPMQIYISDAQYVWRKADLAKASAEDVNKPFFAYLQRAGHYFGISYGEEQYNRAAPAVIPEKKPEELFPEEFFSGIFEEE